MENAFSTKFYIHIYTSVCMYTSNLSFMSAYLCARIKRYTYKQHKHTYVLNHQCIETTKNNRMETFAALL